MHPSGVDVHRDELTRTSVVHGAIEIPAGRSARPTLAITLFVPKSIMRTIDASPGVFASSTANAYRESPVTTTAVARRRGSAITVPLPAPPTPFFSNDRT